MARSRKYRNLPKHGMNMRNQIPMDVQGVRYDQWPPGAAQYAQSTSMDVAGRSVQTNGRTETSPQWPNGGYVTRPMADRNWTVQEFTGYPTSTVGAGQWRRGVLVQHDTVDVALPTLGHIMYDPTDVSTWDYAGR